MESHESAWKWIFIELKDALAHRLYTELNRNGLTPTGERFSAHAISARVRSFLGANTSFKRNTEYSSLTKSMGQNTRTTKKRVELDICHVSDS